MSSSLFGKLKSVLSRQKKSEIATQATVNDVTAGLSRIGMAVKQSAQPVGDSVTNDISQPDVQTTPLPAQEVVMDVGIQFFAEVPLQECADEIVSVSQRAKNCMSAHTQPVGDGIWQVAVTLSMAPIPQEIHNMETVLQAWAEKFGGSSKGWGLSQSQAA
jgi:hypothetical protein